MSDLLAKLKARQAEKEAAEKSSIKMEEENPVGEQVISTAPKISAAVSKLDTSQQEEVVKKEAENIRHKKEADLSKFELPSSIYEIEGLDPERFRDNLIEMETKLTEGETVGLKTYLREILKNIRQFPECAYILSDAQIGMISQAQMKQAHIEIAAKATATGTRKKKSAQQLVFKDGGDIQI